MHDKTLRGADIVAQSLARLGCRRAFTLSGNHIMSIFDAALDTGLDLVHVRHEAAAVHMADAWGRLTGEPGIALVTGGPGHANAVGALFTALAAESPMVLLSGHAATWELGRGGFQELRQADMAAPVAKASWTAQSAAALGHDLGEAWRLATSGRPGPVHVSLPSDLLDARVEMDKVVWPATARPAAATLPAGAVRAVLAAIQAAARPVVLAGPQFSNVAGRARLAHLEAALHVPCVVLESPRGLADATLGAFADLIRACDLVVLLGKALDFTVKWASGPAFDPEVKLIAIDPDPALVERAKKEKGARLLSAWVADPRSAAEELTAAATPEPHPEERASTFQPHPEERASARASRRVTTEAHPKDVAKPHAEERSVLKHDDTTWLATARQMLEDRPSAWATLTAKAPGRLHPAEVFRSLRPTIERDPDTVLICDGGEFAQWAQSMLPVRRRLINGVAGAIGASLPFALAARLAEPKAPVIAVLGDGTVGFHLAEFETALRRRLPFVAIVGNDARWNAESQIQRREYGEQRMHGCDLLPARYDQVVAALGGHGEFVQSAAELPGALDRALKSGKPACVNVSLEGAAAPVIRR